MTLALLSFIACTIIIICLVVFSGIFAALLVGVVHQTNNDGSCNNVHTYILIVILGDE
jgi:hypothetical protein